MAEEIYNRTIDMLNEYKFIKCEELFMKNEAEDKETHEEARSSSSENYEPQEKITKTEHIPLEYKIKVVNIVKAHKGWTLKTLQRRGCSRLKRMDDIPRWEAHIKRGGTIFDKYSIIDSWTKDRFEEARKSHQQVTTRNLQEWALAAASQFRDFQFKASKSWVKQFKQRHGIRQRKIMKHVSESEDSTMEECWTSAETFRSQIRTLIQHFHPNFIINTDQIDCEYQTDSGRTYEHQESKVVMGQEQNITELTCHSHTAQYSITMSGKLLPVVFVCLPEISGSCGKSIAQYSAKYPKVVVVYSKSGKLATHLYKSFLSDCLKPYVQKEKFLLIIDSWDGQTNPVLYDELFQDDDGKVTCTLKVIPSKCTPLVQPCDVYFYRQVKNFIKRLQNCTYLLENKREINSSEDYIKIHSVAHHQLSSPIFCNMIQYAWYASKLCDNREVFMNVNDVCFPIDTLKQLCACTNVTFIICARCRNNYCFPCFYDKYHPGSCM
ncbi:uncharacterized protein LOC108627179 isoform X1 [Ceratina calcarata]|uniref:Uncharacterized protein LOC108627179 isoform X1 n=1 Tax=Ceratina calcarata TaxID=156304 RepID=A0AAJ7S5L9_9HYME|nr:uncharacterized protein LOC108627179 isoform X1 [Ceratina calcarata]XP_026671180.1 uncharacterized protein LOC108627179 isoform X1 [Ceratina calcarata]